MELQADATAAGGVTFVTAVLDNPSPNPMAFRLASTLDGPVWPPRRNGVPEGGWDGDHYRGHLAAGESCSLGFATPAEPTDEPVVLVETNPESDPSRSPDAASTVRSHSDPRPPRAVVSPMTVVAGRRLPGAPVGKPAMEDSP